jgi:RNA polymerase sigma-70 factor (ECF subfamily)
MSDGPTADFPELLARAGGGDPAALDELVRRYEPKIRIVARVLLGPALRPYMDSIDLAQSVHISLVAGLRKEQFSLAGPDDLIGLAVTILRRKAAKHWRRLQRQQRLSGGNTAATSGDLPDVFTAISCPDPDPAVQAQFRDQVDHLCEHLDDEERRIIDQRLEGYTPAEIADRLGVNRVALRVRLTRLRKRLQTAGVVTDWL